MVQFENLTLSQKIAEEIASQIVKGEMDPGERIYEQDLKEVFGTSKAPIREALFLLENQGIVERIPRKGVFVKKYSQKEILDFYEIVYRLTGIALEKGIQLRTKEQLAELFELIYEMENKIEARNFKGCFLLVEDIHRRIFDLPNNLVLRDLYQKLNNRWTTFRYLTLSHPESLRRSVEEYKEIVIGLEEKNLMKVMTVLKEKEERALNILETIM